MVAFGACGILLIASAWPSPIYGATRQFAETPAAGISTGSSAIGVVRRDRGHTATAVTLEMHGLAGRNSSDAVRRPKHEPSTGRSGATRPAPGVAGPAAVGLPLREKGAARSECRSSSIPQLCNRLRRTPEFPSKHQPRALAEMRLALGGR